MLGDRWGGSPEEWVKAIEGIVPGAAAMTSTQLTPANVDAWVASVARAASTIALTVQQQRLLRVQVDRARQGLDPLDTSNYTPGVNFGLTSDTRNMTLILGVLGVAGLFLLSRRGR